MSSSAAMMSAFGSTELDAKIASLENKSMPFPPLPTDDIAELPKLPTLMTSVEEKKTSTSLSLLATDIAPTPTVANIETLENCYLILKKAFENPEAKSEDELEAKIKLKAAYDHGKAEEKQIYEKAVLSGYFKNASITEWTQIKDKILQAANLGDKKAQMIFINAIIDNHRKLASPEEITFAKRLLYDLASYDHPDAQCLLGQYFFEGYSDNIPGRLGEAIFWLKRASEWNYTEAHFLLGKCYQQLSPIAYTGPRFFPIEEALIKAIHVFTKAAKRDHTEAALHLQTCQTEEKASAGDAASQYRLAQCYEEGIGAIQSLSKALGWYEHAYRCSRDPKEKQLYESAWKKLKDQHPTECKNYQMTFNKTFKNADCYGVIDLCQTNREKVENFVNPFSNRKGQYKTPEVKPLKRQETLRLLRLEVPKEAPKDEAISLSFARMKVS